MPKVIFDIEGGKPVTAECNVGDNLLELVFDFELALVLVLELVLDFELSLVWVLDLDLF